MAGKYFCDCLASLPVLMGKREMVAKRQRKLVRGGELQTFTLELPKVHLLVLSGFTGLTKPKAARCGAGTGQFGDGGPQVVIESMAQGAREAGDFFGGWCRALGRERYRRILGCRLPINRVCFCPHTQVWF